MRTCGELAIGINDSYQITIRLKWRWRFLYGAQDRRRASRPTATPQRQSPSPPVFRAREPHIFMSLDVEHIRAKVDLHDATLVSLLAFSGPRPEEVVKRLAWRDIGQRGIRHNDTKRRRVRTRRCSPLWPTIYLNGFSRPGVRRGSTRSACPRRRLLGRLRLAQLVAANRARRASKSVQEEDNTATTSCAPAGTRPRDLLSSCVTVRVCEGVPLTQLAREVGTSVC